MTITSPRNIATAVAAGFIGLVGLHYCAFNGFGKRADIIEHKFTQNGESMAVIREDIIGSWDRYHIEPLSGSMKESPEGTRFDYRQKPMYAIFGTEIADNGDIITARGFEYSITRDK